MSVHTTDIPLVPRGRSGSTASRWGEGFYLVRAHYGFMETPDVPLALLQLSENLRARAAGHGHVPDGRHQLLPRARNAHRDADAAAEARCAAQRRVDFGRGRSAGCCRHAALAEDSSSP